VADKLWAEVMGFLKIRNYSWGQVAYDNFHFVCPFLRVYPFFPCLWLFFSSHKERKKRKLAETNEIGNWSRLEKTNWRATFAAGKQRIKPFISRDVWFFARSPSFFIDSPFGTRLLQISFSFWRNRNAIFRASVPKGKLHLKERPKGLVLFSFHLDVPKLYLDVRKK